jgi:integrase
VNPARVVKKPPQGRGRSVRALSPEDIEAIRGRLRERDAALVSVLAYAGLRPSEALALTWRDIGVQTISVDKALALGEVRSTKTRRRRVVKMLAPLAADLKAWRLASGMPDSGRPVFPMRDGRFWTDTAYRNWRARVFQPAAEAVGVEAPRPYDLRHSLASLLFAEGRNPAEIAEELGHSLQVLLGTYVGVIEELRGKPRQTAEALIRAARGPEMDHSASVDRGCSSEK